MTTIEIPQAVTLSTGKGGLPTITLRERGGHSAEIYLFGATVSSWSSPSQGELLFMSPNADFSGSKPLRGGIPLVFPQFSGLGPLPSHGFARILPWKPLRSSVLPNGTVTMALGLSDATPHSWPHSFEAEFEVRLGQELTTEFRVVNTGASPFSFANAFHTYFKVSAIEEIQIAGLEGLDYLDNTAKRERRPGSTQPLSIGEEVDRVYLCSPARVQIKDRGAKRVITIQKTNFPDCVVWNPWSERCAAIKDLLPDSYQKFVCVEPANTSAQIVLASGESWSCSQVLSYEQGIKCSDD